jgi:hypothetical protein
MTIRIKPSHQGKLHRDLGVKRSEPIPPARLKAAKHSADPAERRRATFAENAKHWDHDWDHGGTRMRHRYRQG